MSAKGATSSNTKSSSTSGDEQAAQSTKVEQQDETPVKIKEETIDLAETESYKTLIEHEINDLLAERLSQLILDNKLSINEFDDNAFTSIKQISDIEEGLTILSDFEQASDDKLKDGRITYLCELIKKSEERVNGEASDSNSSTPNGESSNQNSNQQSPAKSTSTANQQQYPNSNQNQLDELKKKCDEIAQRTGYTFERTAGQHKYGGPPPESVWAGNPPPPGCEIFVGNIPNYVYEDELIVLFEQCGKLWDLRLMINAPTGLSKGYCFITYCTKDDAENAQAKFDGYEIKNGVQLKVNLSVPNLRLFVGNIPKSKSKEEILAEFSKLTPGLQEVIVYSSPDDRKRNRGFCFLEYDSHKSASLAKRKLSTGRTKVWNCDILVDWADPQEEPDNDTMSKVKVLYVRNLVADVSEEQLREHFEKYGPVERVKKIKDYAFVHFAERDHALKAMDELNGSELNGVEIEVSLAKPPSDRKKKEEMLRNRERRVMIMMKQRIGMQVPGLARAPVLSPLTTPMPPAVAAVQMQQTRNPAWWNAWYNYFNGYNAQQAIRAPWWTNYHEQQRLFNGANQPPLPNFNVTATTALQRNQRAGANHPMWQPNPMMGSTNGQKWNKNKQNQYSKSNNSTTKA